jgi:putative hemolysin
MPATSMSRRAAASGIVGPVSATADPLIDINLDELLDSIGVVGRRPVLRSLLRPLASHFARTVRRFDDEVGKAGLAAGSEWLVRRMTGGLQVAGAAQVPAQGPVLILANHPGMTDTVALFASLVARRDLLVIAQDRPFLRALPHVAQRVIFVAEDGASRTRVLRAGARHLAQGGALLTFPAGAIEPDPAAAGATRAIDALQHWSASFALLARAEPATRIVAAIVRDVISADALHHPLTRWRRNAADRDKLAATLQILWRPYQARPARVALGAVDMVAGRADAAALRRAVIARAASLIASPPADAALSESLLCDTGAAGGPLGSPANQARP